MLHVGLMSLHLTTLVTVLLRNVCVSLGRMDQRVIDTAVRQWRTRLRACVKAKGGHFKV